MGIRNYVRVYRVCGGFKFLDLSFYRLGVQLGFAFLE